MTDETSFPEAPFSELDRKIERINILRSLIGQDFIDPETPNANALVIAEVNAEISEFLVDLLNVELGRVREKVVPPVDVERQQAMDWLLSRIVAVLKNPALPNPAATLQAQPAVTPAPVSAPVDQDLGGEPSVHAPMVRGGAAISRPSNRGSGIMELLKQTNPELIAPNDPARAGMSPGQRAEADAAFNAAVRAAEAKAKAQVEARNK